MMIMPRRKVEVSAYEIVRAFFCSFFSGKARRAFFAEEFEKTFAEFIGVRYAMSLPNVRTGLALFLDAGGFANGDEILVPSLNYHVIPAILKNRGLTPVFVDVDPATWTMDPGDVERKITERTKAVIALHVFGQSCRIEELREICRTRRIILIEDAAHACGGLYQGKKLGSFGDLAFFSFGTGKALVAFGGGMAVTNDERIFLRMKKSAHDLGARSGVLSVRSFLSALAETIFTKNMIFSFFVYPLLRAISFFYSGFADQLTEDRYVLDEGDVTVNAIAMSPFQACLALSQFEKLHRLNQQRKERAALLTHLFEDLTEIQAQFQIGRDEHTGLYYALAVPDPDALRKFLFVNGVDTKKGTMRACSSLDFFEGSQKCPVAEKIAPHLVELPCYPSLSDQQVRYQADLIRKFYGKDAAPVGL